MNRAVVCEIHHGRLSNSLCKVSTGERKNSEGIVAIWNLRLAQLELQDGLQTHIQCEIPTALKGVFRNAQVC